MLNAADIAILETYRDNMNAVERGLLDELIRLRDENERNEDLEEKVNALEDQLAEAQEEASDAKDEVTRLEADAVSLREEIIVLRDHELEADRRCSVAEDRLEDLKSSMRSVCE